MADNADVRSAPEPDEAAARPHASGAGHASGIESAAAGDAAETQLGLSRGDRRFALACGGAIWLLIVAHWAQRAFFGARLVEIDRLPAKAYEFRLDINSATWVEWMQLDGVGEVLARRIVADREQHGPFSGIDDVSRVPGVGPKTLDTIRPHLFCSDCPPASAVP